MKKIATLIFATILSSFFTLILAQEKPTDLLKQLPEIFTKVCSAPKDELEIYTKSLGDFISLVNTNLDSLVPLKMKAEISTKISSKSNTAKLAEQLKEVSALISEKDFSIEFAAAMHNEFEKNRNQKIDDIIIKISQTSNYAEMQKLNDEMLKVNIEYCNNSSPHYISLLQEQRALLYRDIEKIIMASDLKQQIDCNVLGHTYYRVLSFENAYLYILDHLNYMYLSLSFVPGEE